MDRLNTLLNKVTTSKTRKAALVMGAVGIVQALSSAGLIHVDPTKLQIALALLGYGSAGTAAWGLRDAIDKTQGK
jgi:hypothetical protein